MVKIKHRVVKQRINKEAWDMKIFTARELLERINNYPNMHGRGVTTRQVTMQRLSNLLKANPNLQHIKNPTNPRHAGKWEWIGDY